MRTGRHGRLWAALVASVLTQVFSSSIARAGAPAMPPAAFDNPRRAGPDQTAVLAGGCFWGMQALFEHVRGVRRVLAGYAGGTAATAHYVMVGAGTTGHAESIQITFDPAELSYGDILRVYFSVAHDPTELDRQGPDQGRRYRSDIFYRDASQQRIAQTYIGQLREARVFDRPIVTRLDALTGFYPAESYQQDFVVHNMDYDYVVQNDLPRIAALQRLYPDLYRGEPILASAGAGRGGISAASPSRHPAH